MNNSEPRAHKRNRKIEYLTQEPWRTNPRAQTEAIRWCFPAKKDQLTHGLDGSVVCRSRNFEDACKGQVERRRIDNIEVYFEGNSTTPLDPKDKSKDSCNKKYIKCELN